MWSACQRPQTAQRVTARPCTQEPAPAMLPGGRVVPFTATHSFVVGGAPMTVLYPRRTEAHYPRQAGEDHPQEERPPPIVDGPLASVPVRPSRLPVSKNPDGLGLPRPFSDGTRGIPGPALTSDCEAGQRQLDPDRRGRGLNAPGVCVIGPPILVSWPRRRRPGAWRHRGPAYRM